MKIHAMIATLLCLYGTSHGATRREVFSNSAVHLAITCGDLTGSGFIFFRVADLSNENQPPVSGRVFLVTNKHVLPPEGRECKLSMRVSITFNGAPSLKIIEIPVVGANGKYLDTLRLHKDNDVAVISITPEIASNGITPDFVPTTLLGTKDKLKKGDAALVGDEIYILGYPAGLFDKRNASPIWRIGIIATSPLLGYAFPDDLQKALKLPSFVDGFLVDAQVYPGSSGSAVVIKPQPISFDNPSSLVAGGPRSITYVLGIISGSIPIGDFGGKVVSRMGIGVVQSADAVNETIEAFFKK